MRAWSRSPQAEIRNDSVTQTYRCSHPKCGKTFTSMDVWQLLPSAAAVAAGASSQLSCSICGSEIKMTLDESGRELGSMEDKKERQKVRARGAR
jgi:DNA-directed RNA polymerase subunit RPC12/RpoP